MGHLGKKFGKAVAIGGLFICGSVLDQPVKADTAAAETTFKSKCAPCHGADAKGKDAMGTRDLSSEEVQKQSDADLSTIITSGKNKMPAFKSMTT
ncbi:MAG TPA: cytochrome c, partial [Candidatus Acidoferrum sp.]|nr:cytochrome c [Candidatus Acidoferrum sp.]